MTGLTFIAACAVSFLCTPLFTRQGQAIETCMALHGGRCSTKEMRRVELKRVLDKSGCNSYSCGKPYTCNKSCSCRNWYNTSSFNIALQQVLNLGVTANHPAHSCADIFQRWPIANALSGYYWLWSANGSAVRVFCDMTLTCKGVGGGWMQVAKLDMTNSSHQCPPGTRPRTYRPKRLCGNSNGTGPGCSSILFSVHGIEYRQVCGKIIAYQYASTDAFGTFDVSVRAHLIDGNYVDGISLTHGSHPRNHIWTFAAALDEVGTFPNYNCLCTNTSLVDFATPPPSFVGNDYFCDTGSTNRWLHIFYPEDPLWDGAGCGPANTCCSLNNPPWFLKQLPSTSTDDIEMRMCRDQLFEPGINIDEDTPIEIIELYIR